MFTKPLGIISVSVPGLEIIIPLEAVTPRRQTETLPLTGRKGGWR